MKIAVIGANGKAGQLIVKEALDRGMEVTAIVRHANQSAASAVINKDLFALTREDLAQFNAVVSAVGVWTAETMPEFAKGGAHLSSLLSGSQTRLLIVGGASSLYIDKDHTTALYQTPDFPDAYKPVADAHRDLLEILHNSKDLKWTYVSPAAEFKPDLPRTGKYILAGEEFTLNSRGVSEIGYADYAVAMVDEIEKGQHFAQQISVVAD